MFPSFCMIDANILNSWAAISAKSTRKKWR